MSRVIDLAALPTDSGIVFPEGTSLNIDSNTLYIDSANNRIGIGTSSPAAKLQVNTTGGGVFQVTDWGASSQIGTDTAGQALRINGVDSVRFHTGTAGSQTERMRITNAGNVGIGTTSPSQELHVYGNNADGARIRLESTDYYTSLDMVAADGTSNVINFGDASDVNVGRIEYDHSANAMFIKTNDAERMRIDANGNVGIGTSSPFDALHVEGTIRGNVSDASDENIRLTTTGGGGFVVEVDDATVANPTWSIRTFANEPLTINVGGTDKMRIDSSGHCFINPTASGFTTVIGGSTITDPGGNNPGLLVNRSASDNPVISAYMPTTIGTRNGLVIYSNSGGTGTLQCQLRLGGDAYNRTGTWGTISDSRLKENIVDATSKLNEVKQLQVRNFNFIGDDLKQIGFVAQEIEQVFPSVVDTPTLEDGTVDPNGHKKVKTTVLIPILTKALQEAITKIETLETRIQALENN